MITKFEQYNEGIKHLLVGPSKDELWDKYKDKLKGLIEYLPESPEDFFNQMKDGCSIIPKNGWGIYFGKNNIILFRQNLEDKKLWINFNCIWFILNKVYGLNDTEIQILLKKLLHNDKNWSGLIYYYMFFD